MSTSLVNTRFKVVLFVWFFVEKLSFTDLSIKSTNRLVEKMVSSVSRLRISLVEDSPKVFSKYDWQTLSYIYTYLKDFGCLSKTFINKYLFIFLFLLMPPPLWLSSFSHIFVWVVGITTKITITLTLDVFYFSVMHIWPSLLCIVFNM